MAKAVIKLLDGRTMEVNGPDAQTVQARVDQFLQSMKGGETPFQLPMSPSAEQVFSPEQMQAAQGRMGARYSPGQLAAAQTGVDISSGSPVGRFAGGFSQNQALQAQYVQKQLESHYGQPVEMRVGPYTNALEFKNPQTGRFTLVNEARLTARDLGGAVGPAVTALAAGAGELLGGPPGAAVGGAIGEGIRRGVGHVMGLRDQPAKEEIVGSLGSGAVEGGASLGSRLVTRGGQAVRDVIFPKNITAREARELISRMDANQKVADEIAAASGQEFKPFTSQLTEDSALLAEQERMMSSKEMGAAARERLQQNESALEEYFYARTPTGGPPSTQVGRSIQTEARDQLQPRVEQIEEGVNRQIAGLEALTQNLPRTSDMAAGERLRGVIASRREEAKRNVDALWVNVREAYGYDPETALSAFRVPVDGQLETTLRRLSTEAKEAIDPATATGKRTLLPPKLAREETQLEKDMNQLLAELGEDVSSSHSVDLHQLQVLLQSLRRRERLAYTNVSAADPEMRDLTTVRDALVTQRNEYLKNTNPELLSKIETAEAARAQLSQVFDRGAVGQILRKTQGEYVIADSDVVAKAFASGQPEAMRHLVSVMSQHPAGLPALQDAILSFYRQEVVENGIPKGALHARFLEKYGDALDLAFPGQRNIVRQLGEIEGVVAKNMKRFEDFRARVNRTFRGKIQNLDPERVVEDVFSRSLSQRDVSSLMRLATNAGVDKQYRQAVGDMIRRKYVALSGEVKIDALNSFVEANRAKLASVFGNLYINDMRTLVRGAQIARTRSSGVSGSAAPSLIEGVIRVSMAPPLSARGVALTRANRFRAAAANRLMNEVLMDPKKLHEFVTLANTDLRNRRVAGFLATVGASSLAVQENE